MEFGTASYPIHHDDMEVRSNVVRLSDAKLKPLNSKLWYDGLVWSQEVGKYVRFVYDNSDRHTSESDRQNSKSDLTCPGHKALQMNAAT